MAPDFPDDLSRIPLPPVVQISGQLQGAAEAQRRCPLLRAQVDVPGTHGQAVRLPRRGHADDFQVHVQVQDHPPNGRQLLKILFPEDGRVGLDQVEELGADRRHAPEMAGPGQSAQVVGHVFDGDVGLIMGRIHLCVRRREDHVHAHPFGHGTVPLEIPGILFEILAGTELGRVDVDAHDQAVAPSPAFPHEIEVTLVEIPHGGNERHDLPLFSQGFREGLHCPCGLDYFHQPLTFRPQKKASPS